MLPKNLAPSTLAQQILPRRPLILLDMCFQHEYCTSLDTCRCFLPTTNFQLTFCVTPKRHKHKNITKTLSHEVNAWDANDREQKKNWPIIPAPSHRGFPKLDIHNGRLEWWMPSWTADSIWSFLSHKNSLHAKLVRTFVNTIVDWL